MGRNDEPLAVETLGNHSEAQNWGEGNGAGFGALHSLNVVGEGNQAQNVVQNEGILSVCADIYNGQRGNAEGRVIKRREGGERENSAFVLIETVDLDIGVALADDVGVGYRAQDVVAPEDLLKYNS